MPTRAYATHILRLVPPLHICMVFNSWDVLAMLTDTFPLSWACLLHTAMSMLFVGYPRALTETPTEAHATGLHTIILLLCLFLFYFCSSPSVFVAG
ncbi:hypothetical protein C2E23DRAFT_804811 [Lenzites betulinus]|nr:hypothetical protein C2E23DRAFT_804811 [Lenzites betulinus]